MRSEVIQGQGLDSADLSEFWSECDRAGVSIAFHGGTHLQAGTAGSDRFSSRFSMHACSHPMEAQMAFLSLLEGGVFESNPGLKFAFLEAGCSWLPSWLWRLDNICYQESYEEVKDTIRLKPSEYFKRQCWVGIELGEPCIREVVEVIGVERLLFGTDFPHPDHLDLTIKKVGGSACSLGLTMFSDDELSKIFEENPSQFFSLTQ